jgi:hypothetical protein
VEEGTGGIRTIQLQEVGSVLRKLKLVIVTGVAAVCVIAAAPPAQAASGGGCQNTSAIRACISVVASSILSDFYLIWPPDSSRCTALVQMIRNGSFVMQSRWYNLTYQGRYGPINAPVADPAYAQTKVTVYTCSGVKHFEAWSPKQYYP